MKNSCTDTVIQYYNTTILQGYSVSVIQYFGIIVIQEYNSSIIYSEMLYGKKTAIGRAEFSTRLHG